jgi:methionyl aminopeptidase
MCLAIEPMFTLGDGDVFIEADNRTVATQDDALASHFEHTIAIMADGPQILTTV